MAAESDTLGALAQRIGRTVRGARLAQAMSLGDLARAASLSKTILARIERGEGNPSVETLWRVSHALSLPLGELLGDQDAPRTRVVRAGEGEALTADSGMAAWLLHTEVRDHRTEVYDLDLPKGVDQRSGAHLPGTEELIVCVRGRVLAGAVGDEAELAPGDAVWFVADGPHHYVGLRDSRALCLMLYTGATG